MRDEDIDEALYDTLTVEEGMDWQRFGWSGPRRDLVRSGLRAIAAAVLGWLVLLGLFVLSVPMVEASHGLFLLFGSLLLTLTTVLTVVSFIGVIQVIRGWRMSEPVLELTPVGVRAAGHTLSWGDLRTLRAVVDSRIVARQARVSTERRRELQFALAPERKARLHDHAWTLIADLDDGGRHILARHLSTHEKDALLAAIRSARQWMLSERDRDAEAALAEMRCRP